MLHCKFVYHIKPHMDKRENHHHSRNGIFSQVIFFSRFILGSFGMIGWVLLEFVFIECERILLPLTCHTLVVSVFLRSRHLWWEPATASISVWCVWRDDQLFVITADSLHARLFYTAHKIISCSCASLISIKYKCT